MEIRRFGPGHRRSEGPPGTHGLAGQVIWSDPRAHVSELAFSRRGLIAPHANRDTTLFIVVSGGGWLQVGEERVAVNHGEAVVLPPGVPHAAWTEGTEMRAILVELPEGIGPAAHRVVDGLVQPVVERAGAADATPARGALADRPARPEDHDPTEGEPW